MREGGVKKRLVGTVVSNKPDKTAVVVVQRLTRHRTYGKFIRRRAKYMAHDPNNRCRIGDTVSLIESRPMSKRKRWRVLEIFDSKNKEVKG